MAEVASTVRRFNVGQLEEFITNIFAAIGIPDGDANKIARLMADADLNGSDGHGIFRLPAYIRRIREGGLNLHPDIRVVSERNAQALVDFWQHRGSANEGSSLARSAVMTYIGLCVLLLVLTTTVHAGAMVRAFDGMKLTHARRWGPRSGNARRNRRAGRAMPRSLTTLGPAASRFRDRLAQRQTHRS